MAKAELKPHDITGALALVIKGGAVRPLPLMEGPASH